MKTKTLNLHRHFAFAYVLLVAVIFCGCVKSEHKEVYKYTITYGGISGGWFKTNEYSVKNGYYLFECGGDSIKLKESLINVVAKNNCR